MAIAEFLLRLVNELLLDADWFAPRSRRAKCATPDLPLNAIWFPDIGK